MSSGVLACVTTSSNCCYLNASVYLSVSLSVIYIHTGLTVQSFYSIIQCFLLTQSHVNLKIANYSWG